MRTALVSLAAVLAAGCNPTVSFDTTVKGNAVVRGSPNPLPVQLPSSLGFNNISFAPPPDFGLSSVN